MGNIFLHHVDFVIKNECKECNKIAYKKIVKIKTSG